MATRLSRIIADFETSLSTAVSVGDSSFTLQSVTDADGSTLSDGIYCFTLDRDNTSSKEYIVGQLTASTKTVSSIYSVSRNGTETANFQKAHRIGTNVIISDHSVLNSIVKILNGTGTLDSGSPIGYDATATISGANMLATKAYVDSVVNGGTVTYDKQILSAQTAGETIAEGDIVYLKASDSRWWKADADDSTTYDKVQLGVALGAGTAGNTISGGVQISGPCSAFTGLTANTLYYLSSTLGGISTSAGTPKISIGVATSTTTISLDFKSYSIPTGAEKDAMAGGSTFGTPSSTNKYLTQDYWTANFIMDSGLVGHTTSNTTVSNSNTETVVYTKSISAGLLSSNDGLMIDIFGSVTVDTNSDNPVVRVKFDNTDVAIIDFPGGGSGVASKSAVFNIRVYIINNNSLSSQNVLAILNGGAEGFIKIQDNGTTGADLSIVNYILDSTASFNTANAFDLKVSFQNENTAAGESWTFNGAVVTKLGSI